MQKSMEKEMNFQLSRGSLQADVFAELARACNACRRRPASSEGPSLYMRVEKRASNKEKKEVLFPGEERLIGPGFRKMFVYTFRLQRQVGFETIREVKKEEERKRRLRETPITSRAWCRLPPEREEARAPHT